MAAMANTPPWKGQNSTNETAITTSSRLPVELRRAISWFSARRIFTGRTGWLRLFAVAKPNSATNLLGVSNVVLQKLPALEFTVTTKLDVNHLVLGEMAGLIILGGNYSFAAIERTGTRSRLTIVSGDS